MLRPSVLIASAVLAAAVASPPLTGAQRESTERHVYVRVTGANDAPVSGLTARDFIVREDDIAREVIRVSTAPPPSHLALLVDNTGDLQPLLIELRTSLLSFVTSMTALAAPPLMTLSTVAERPTTLVDFTTSDIAIERGIQRIFPRMGSGAYLLDGIIEASQALRKAGAERPAILVFVIEHSTEFSNRLHTLVADALRDTGASLWTIELQQQGSPSMAIEARERARVVTDVTGWSGGVSRRIISRQGLPQAFTEISTAMTTRYDVVYGRPQSLVPPSRISVETRDRSHRVTAPRWISR
jgi:hypothetical protein